MSRHARLLASVLALALLGPGPARAAEEPVRPALPAPDLIPFVRTVSPAFDKPALPLPALRLPAAPVDVPELPPPPVAGDPALRLTSPQLGARALACNPLGTFFGVASEILECGRARLQRGELDQARQDFQNVLQRTAERDLVREARYWLAEILLRLGRRDAVEQYLRLVMQDDPRGDFAPFAANLLGWVLLERGDPGRALPLFESVVRGSVSPDLIPPARHGRALALYGLRRYAEARDEWAALLRRGIPQALATEANFWLGDTLGRLGDAPGAADRLQQFTAAGPRVLIDSGLLRLAWWRSVAGQPLEAVKGYRGFLSAYPRSSEVPWARAGLVRALLDLDDVAGAQEEARRLEADDPAGALAQPALLAVAGRVAERGRPEQAQPLLQELLAKTLSPASRAWVLVASGEMAYRTGDKATARARFEAARRASEDALAVHATLRLAEIELEAREFARARATAESLLGGSAPPDARAAALIIAGEAAYGAREYERAAGLYGRFGEEFATHAQAPGVTLALAWAEYRRGRGAEAARLWARFAETAPTDPRTAAALLLAAEQAIQAGDTHRAETLLDRLVTRFPDDESATVARLNRAVLALRRGRASDALRDLSALLPRLRLSPYVGRARFAHAVALLAVGRADEARREFGVALTEGEDAGHLGLAVAALGARRWEEAEQAFATARDRGLGPGVGAVEYGLAAAAFGGGRKDEFRRRASALLASPADPATTPHLLHASVVLAAEDKQWPEARAGVQRLAGEFPQHPVTAAALATVAASASAAAEWPLAREAYQALADRHPASPALGAGALDFAEALLRTGAPGEAQIRLERFVRDTPADPRLPRALLLLARAHEITGNRVGAIEAYERLRRDHPGAVRGTAGLAQARLLHAEGRINEARLILRRTMETGEVAEAVEAAYWLGEGHRAAGQSLEAAEMYMTAAYLAPDSPWARRALIGAGQAFQTLGQSASAVIVYRKVVTAKGVEPDVAEAARAALRALGTPER